MAYIYIFIILFNMSSAISFYFKKRIEETFFISIAFKILTLFLFGVFINLEVGFYFLLFLNIPIFIYNIFYILKKEPKLTDSILTPGLFIYSLIYLLVIWINYDRVVIVWDEFSHWALVVKNMFFSNGFGLGSDSTVVAKNYLSGTSLFQYFCMKINGSYDESFLFIGMNLTLFSFLIPLFKVFKNIKNIAIYIFLFIIITIPTLFYNSYYCNLYVDAILGIAFAYSIYIYYFNYEEGLDKFNIINLSLATMMLVFIKDIGFYFAVITTSIIFIDNILIRTNLQLKLRSIWDSSKKIALIFLPMLIVKILWIYTLSVNSVNSSISSSSAKGFLSNFLLIFSFNRNGYKFIVIHNFLSAIFYKGLFENQITISFFSSLILFFALTYIIIEKISESKIKKSYLLMISILEVGAIGYAVILLLSYLTIFSEYEALILASYERYIGTYILALSIIITSLLLQKYSNNLKALLKGSIICLLVLVFFTNFGSTLNMTFFARGSINYAKSIRSNYLLMHENIQKNVEKNKRVYFISSNDTGLDFWISKYEITPQNCIKNRSEWSIGKPYYDGDIWTIDKSPQEWAKELVKDYDYVYLFDIDEQFVKTYKSIFNVISNKIYDNQLYKINQTSNNLKILDLVAK